MSESVSGARREADLDVHPAIRREVEYSEDGTGRPIYRHVIYTEWQVVPGV